MEKDTLERPGERDVTESDEVVNKKADIGLQFIKQHGGAVEFTEEEDSRVRWKLDLYLMPIVREPAVHGYVCRHP